jgi:hypothetical protein
MKLSAKKRSEWIRKCFPPEDKIEILESKQEILLEKIFWEDISKFKIKNPDIVVTQNNLSEMFVKAFSPNMTPYIYSETDSIEEKNDKISTFVQRAFYHIVMIKDFMDIDDLYLPRQDLVFDSHAELRYWLRCAKCGTIIEGSDSSSDYTGSYPIICPHCVKHLKPEYRLCTYIFPENDSFPNTEDWAIFNWRSDNDKWFKRWLWLRARPGYIKHWLFKTFRPKAYKYKVDHLFDYLKEVG